MNEFNTKSFYNHIANKYHWFFSSWKKLMEHEVKQIDTILKKYNVKSVLDCSCGTGLQSIGLAKIGYKVDASDLSEGMINKAKQNAKGSDVNIKFKQADFRRLGEHYSQKYDAVITWGNSIPHLMNSSDMLKALSSIYECTNSDGVAVFEMRNYDRMLTNKNRFLPMRINDVIDDKRYSIVYVFDYLEKVIRFNILYLIEDLKSGDKHMETESVDYNPIQKSEFQKLLKTTGFKNIVVEEDETNILYIAEK